ncbi:hypothetical protein J6TS7_29320 [Paenibacillus dendritiformis]|nr:hypothetical protein J6TS7_29320 [Paenibacillus dendritiformis]
MVAFLPESYFMGDERALLDSLDSRAAPRPHSAMRARQWVREGIKELAKDPLVKGKPPGV